MLWSYINLPFLLIVTCCCMLGICYCFDRYKKPEQRKSTFLGCVLLVSLIAFNLIRQHTFPDAESKIFLNTDYHVLEHLGYAFKGHLSIADNKNVDCLWDQIDGVLTLNDDEKSKVIIEGKNIYTPLYAKINSTKSFQLLNPYYKKPITDTLVIKQNNLTILKLHLKAIDEDTTHYYITFSDTAAFKKVKFNKTLKKGYPLSKLIHKSDTISVPTALDSVWICRAELGNVVSPLYLMPSPSMVMDKQITVVNNEKPAKHHFSTDISYGGAFFSGVDDTSEDIYFVRKGMIKFKMPGRYRLKTDGKSGTSQTLLISSKQGQFEQTALKGGYFLNNFTNEENSNHIKAEIDYTEGGANEAFQFSLTDYKKQTKGGDTLVGIANHPFFINTENNKVSWVMQIHDLRSSFPIQPAYLYWFVFLFWAIVTLLVFYNGIEKTTVVEAIAYFVIFPFIFVRILVHWRIGVFPPLEDIGSNTWGELRGIKGFSRVSLCFIVFAVIRLFATKKFRDSDLFYKIEQYGVSARTRASKITSKEWVIPNLPYMPWRGQKLSAEVMLNWCKNSYSSDNLWRYIQIHILSLVVLKVLLLIGGERAITFANIALPVTLYLIFDFYHNKWDKSKKETIFRLVNNVITTSYLAVFDAGFSIIFLLYLLLSSAIEKFIYLTQSKSANSKEWDYNIKLIGGSVLLFSMVTLFNTQIIVAVFKFMERNPNIIALPIFAILGWITQAFLRILLDKDIKWVKKCNFSFKGKQFALTKHLIPTVATIFAIGYIYAALTNLPAETINKYSYIKYRAAIHTTSIEDILPQVKFASRDIDKIREASQNQWFINTYIHADRADTLFYDNPLLNMQPDFNQGVSYTTQTTDLVTSRYLIPEYSNWTVILMIALLAFFASIYATRYDLRQTNNTTEHSIILLVLTAALFVWLTATNRFTFFGQDFPFVSVTSTFAVVFYFGLFLTVIIGAETDKNVPNKHNPYFYRIGIQLIPFMLLFVIIVLQGWVGNLKIEDSFFNMSGLVEEISTEINPLNERFKTYQANLESTDQKHERNLETNVGSFITAELNSETQKSKFWNSVLESLKGANKTQLRNPENIIHIVRKYSTDNAWDWEFRVNPQYYLVKPPYFDKKQWRGDLLGGQSHKGWVAIDRESDTLAAKYDATKPSVIGFSDTGSKQKNQHNIQIITVPERWKKDSVASMILFLDEANHYISTINVRNPISPQVKIAKGANALLLFNDDEISYKISNQPLSYKFTSKYKNYLMKNIWLNGRQRMFFPLGEKCLWAYHFANATKKALSSDNINLKENKQVSIDYNLTNDLHLLIEKHIRGYHNNGDDLSEERLKIARLGITVIDSRGRIRAINDFDLKSRDQIKRRNPNNWKSIGDIQRFLYLDQSRKAEREVLGNLNLLKLPVGPGSTIKPIVFTAVSSQSASVPWDNLRQVEAYPSDSISFKDEKGKWWLHKYAELSLRGKKDKKAGWLLKDSEFNNYSQKEYLIHSKNIYHSLIVYLGSYNKADLKKIRTPQKLLKPAVTAKSFPVFTLGGTEKWTFDPNKAPQNSDTDTMSFFGNGNSAMSEGLKKNFNLITGKEESGILQNIDFSKDSILYKNKGNAFFAFPETSNFFQKDRTATKKENFNIAIHQTSLGGDPIYVTPLKMAEMFGALAKFDKEFQLSLNDSPSSSIPVFDTDPEWGSSYHDFVKSNIYKPLNDVPKIGTAKSLGNILPDIKSKNPKYYYYAKTGTLGNALKGQVKILYVIEEDGIKKDKYRDKVKVKDEDKYRMDDRLLALIISKKDLSSLSLEEQATNPFYVIYFSQLNFGDHDWSLISKIITTIEGSIIFKQFMNEKK